MKIISGMSKLSPRKCSESTRCNFYRILCKINDRCGANAYFAFRRVFVSRSHFSRVLDVLIVGVCEVTRVMSRVATVVI